MKEYLANLLDASTLPQKIVVIFDGVKYDVTASNEYMWGGDNYPFEIYQEDEMTIIATDDMNEHSIGAYVMKKEESEGFEMFFDFTMTTGEIVEVFTDVTPNDVVSALSNNKYPIARVSSEGVELYLPLTFCAGDVAIQFSGSVSGDMISIVYQNGSWEAIV